MTRFHRLRSRRDVLAGLGAAGASLALGPAWAADRPMVSVDRVTTCDNAGLAVSDAARRVATVADFARADTCRLARDSVEGPYFICTGAANARDIAGGLDGTPLVQALRVTDRGCSPIPGAVVDVWQCDARGNYSGHAVDPDGGSSPRGRRRGHWREPDAPTRFQRGVLVTDADGIAEFDAIYPGYYVGRAIHTHFKVHLGDRAFLTSQALFPEAWNTKILANPVYTEGRKAGRVVNARDFFSRGPLFTVAERGKRLLATISLALAT